MKYTAFALAGALAMTASGAALAAGTSFTADAGSGTYTGNSATLTTYGQQTTGGAAWASTTLSGPPVFEADFSFQLTGNPEGSSNMGNGFTFVLSPDPSPSAPQFGLTSTNLGLGTTSTPELAIAFSPFANTGNNLSAANVVYETTNGLASYDSMVNSAHTVGSGCPGTNAAVAGCFSNGDVWSADIKYANGLLTVTLDDGKTLVDSFTLATPSLAFLSGPLLAGFTASNGFRTETTNITNFQFAVPEPASLAAFGVGLAALGFFRLRRRAV